MSKYISWCVEAISEGSGILWALQRHKHNRNWADTNYKPTRFGCKNAKTYELYINSRMHLIFQIKQLTRCFSFKIDLYSSFSCILISKSSWLSRLLIHGVESFSNLVPLKFAGKSVREWFVVIGWLSFDVNSHVESQQYSEYSK